MANWCNGVLYVTGPEPEARRFMRAASNWRDARARTRRRRSKSTARRVGPLLSFAALLPLRTPDDRDEAEVRYGTFSVEPLDPARDPLERLPGGLARVRYRFQTQWSPPERLIAAVAPRFPALCFVLGYVEPNMDMAGSLLFGRGETRAYELGARRKEAIYRKHQARWARWARQGKTEDSEDNELFADWDADSEVMDVVMTRWDKVVAGRLAPASIKAPVKRAGER